MASPQGDIASAAPPADPIATTADTIATEATDPTSTSDMPDSSHDTTAAVAVAAAAAAAAAVAEARASAEAEAEQAGQQAQAQAQQQAQADTDASIPEASPTDSGRAKRLRDGALESGATLEEDVEDGDMSPRKLARLESGSRFDDTTTTAPTTSATSDPT